MLMFFQEIAHFPATFMKLGGIEQMTRNISRTTAAILERSYGEDIGEEEAVGSVHHSAAKEEDLLSNIDQAHTEAIEEDYRRGWWAADEEEERLRAAS